MKHLIILLLIILTSCKSKTNDDVEASEEAIKTEKAEPKVVFNLIDTVLKNLNIKKENCDLNLIASKENPNNPNETIFAIPEIANSDTEDDTYFEFNSHILIVDSKTGEIKQKYFESAKIGGWTSDAIILADIKIDTADYTISENKRAFGVRVYYHNNSQPNPYSNETISLYLKTDNSLIKILKNYEVMSSSGESDTVCYGDFIVSNKELMISKGKTNNYFNILVNNTITETKSRPGKNNDCIDSDVITSKAITLAFNNNEYKKSNKQDLILATIDSVSIAQIKYYSNPRKSIFDYYKVETEDEVKIWSDKMFGRCCTEADLNYSELLDFDISANVENIDYPISNLSDQTYRKAYVFKENVNIEITLKLLKDSENHVYHTNLSVDNILKQNDTILKPFRLSLVNGYVKSEALFKKNGSVKTLEIYLNSEYQNTILLQDTPYIQEFSVDFAFFKNDVIKLIPVSYYKGTEYDDICISEIQSSMAEITHSSLNKKYKVRELFNNQIKKNKP